MPPDSAPDIVASGLELHRAGRLEEAERFYRAALAQEPHCAPALHCLGILASQTGRGMLAVELLGQAASLLPEDPVVLCNLGVALVERRDFPGAIDVLRRAVELRPDYAMACYNLGTAWEGSGRLPEAATAYRRAIELDPANTRARCNLGNVLKDLGALDEAEAVDRALIALAPAEAAAHNNLGSVLKEQGRMAEALESVRRAVALAPDDAALASNLAYESLFDPDGDPGTLREVCTRWERQHGAPLAGSIQPHANDPTPDRRLRVGYVSPNFWHHVICHFLTPLLEAHDHAKFEVCCYSTGRRADAVTERLRRTADLWRDVSDAHDQDLAETIRADGIDILVDLTQHMAEGRLPVFARQPAPVQVAWVGYPGSTGLRAMHYRLTDAHLEPEGSPWSEPVEKAVRLPDSWFCFDPIDHFPPPGELPALRAGHVTFGCLNSFAKVHEGVLQRWAGVLRAVPRSRLLLRCPVGSTQARVRDFFAAQGIGPERLELVAWTSTREEFLALFQRLDLALDPFPYNGGTTTCEALWMGIPVLTLPGEMIVSRLGLSILTAAGMPEFVAESEADFVRLAAALAGDLPRLSHLRATLRERMKASPFMDGPRFARQVEHAYRQMWGAWCAEQSPQPQPAQPAP